MRWRRITDGAELGPYKEVKFTQEDQAGGRLPWRSLLLTEKAERAERRDQFSGRMLRNRLWLRLLLEECKDGGLKVKRRTKRKKLGCGQVHKLLQTGPTGGKSPF